MIFLSFRLLIDVIREEKGIRELASQDEFVSAVVLLAFGLVMMLFSRTPIPC